MKKNVFFILLCLLFSSVHAFNPGEPAASLPSYPENIRFNPFFSDSTPQGEAEAPKEPSPWTVSADFGLNIAQTAFFNWAAGGDNSISTNGKIKVLWEYMKNRHRWNGSFNTEYGLMYTTTNKLNKTLDDIFFTTQYGYGMTTKGSWFYSVNLDFRTQYDKGYKELSDVNYVSKFMAPAYLNASIGVEYKLKSMLTVYLSPITSRTTFVCDSMLAAKGSYGVTPGKNILSQMGLSLKSNFYIDICKNVSFSNYISLFTPYEKDQFGNFVVDWEFTFNFKVNNFLNATLSGNLKYDDKIRGTDKNGNPVGPKVQFKQLLTVGLIYRIANK